MTRSQRRAAWATALAVVSAACTAALPHVESLPPQYRVAGVAVAFVGAVAGAVLAALNQSLHPYHVSIPVEEARRAGVAKGQTEARP